MNNTKTAQRKALLAAITVFVIGGGDNSTGRRAARLLL